MKISIDNLRKNILNELQLNFSKENSILIADYLIWTEMSGIKTQGIIKLIGTNPLQKIEPVHEIRIERETKLSQLMNAGSNPAPLASQIATSNAIKKAKEHGFGIVGVHNTFSSNGAQAFYSEKIANEDLIAIVCSRSPAAATGFNSIDPLFGTNPISFAFPTKNGPLVFDMATSAMTFYGLILAKAQGKKLPENIAIDKNGNLTTSPEEAMDGAILPFDKSYKGAGLGMMIEILAGPLVNSSWVDNKTFNEEWGSLFIAIDPELLIDLKQFKENCSDLLEKVKSSRKKDGKEIRLPGERAKKEYEDAKKSGYVEVEDSIAKELGW